MKKKINNINFTKFFSVGAFLSILLLGLPSCDEDVTPSLYVEEPIGATPVINSLDPPESALAGVTSIIISGENFSSVPEDNLVFFKSIPAEILEASENQLIVKAPNLVEESVEVKIAVAGAELFSNTYSYKLEPAVEEIYGFKDFEQPYALTTDLDGNIYFSLVSANVGQGVKKLTPDGELLDFAPKGGETFYNGLKYGPSGALYGVRAVRAVFEITEGNSPATFAVLDNGTTMLDLDFDKNSNIWTGGTGGKIYRITMDKDIKSFEFEPKISSIRVFDDYLYVSAASETEEAVWRFQIVSSDSLGTPEKYFDFSANYAFGTITTKAITFSADGELFIGINGDETIVVVHPDGSHNAWYSGLLIPPVLNFAWDSETNLYYSRGVTDEANQTILRINMERAGAPHYGRD